MLRRTCQPPCLHVCSCKHPRSHSSTPRSCSGAPPPTRSALRRRRSPSPPPWRAPPLHSSACHAMGADVAPIWCNLCWHLQCCANPFAPLAHSHASPPCPCHPLLESRGHFAASSPHTAMSVAGFARPMECLLLSRTSQARRRVLPVRKYNNPLGHTPPKPARGLICMSTGDGELMVFRF